MCGRSENVRKCSSELGICGRFPRCFNHKKLCEEDLSDVAGGTAAGLDQDYFTRGGINIQRTGVIKTPHAPSMSAGSNDLSVEEISSAARTTANTVVMVCPMCGSLAEQWSFSGGRLKCKACGRMH